MSAYAYDATGFLLSVVAAAGPDRAKVRAVLVGMDSPAKGYPGVTGLTFFTPSGDCRKPACVKTVRQGVFVPALRQMETSPAP